MHITHLKVNKTTISAERCIAPLTEGLVGGTVSFEFSPDWEGLVRTVCFSNNRKDTYDLSEASTTIDWSAVPIASQVLALAGKEVYVGIRGTDGENTTIPTLWEYLGLCEDGANPSGHEPPDNKPSWPDMVDAEIAQNKEDVDKARKDILHLTENKQNKLSGNLHEVSTFDGNGNVVSRILTAADMGGGLYVVAESANAPVKVLINVTSQQELDEVLRTKKAPSTAGTVPLPSFGMTFPVLFADGNSVPAFTLKFFQDPEQKEYKATTSGGEIPSFTVPAGDVGVQIDCTFANGVIQLVNTPGNGDGVTEAQLNEAKHTHMKVTISEAQPATVPPTYVSNKSSEEIIAQHDAEGSFTVSYPGSGTEPEIQLDFIEIDRRNKAIILDHTIQKTGNRLLVTITGTAVDHVIIPSDSVKFTSQDLTAEEQKQVKKNINANGLPVIRSDDGSKSGKLKTITLENAIKYGTVGHNTVWFVTDDSHELNDEDFKKVQIGNLVFFHVLVDDGTGTVKEAYIESVINAVNSSSCSATGVALHYGVGASSAVLFTPQTLTPAQQAQVRENMGVTAANIIATVPQGITAEENVQAVLNALAERGQATTLKRTRNADSASDQRVTKLKSQLAESDYKAIKFAEGLIPPEEYEPIKQDRQRIRNEINKIEGFKQVSNT